MNYINTDKSQKGAILIFSIWILASVLSITFAVLGIFIPKLKIASEPIKSAIAFFAADSAAEWCLYINRGNPTPELLPSPIMTSGASIIIYYPSASFTPANCTSAETPLSHRAVGTYRDVSRSLEIR